MQDGGPEDADGAVNGSIVALCGPLRAESGSQSSQAVNSSGGKCDLAAEAATPQHREQVGGFLNRPLSEHLGVHLFEFQGRHRHNQSLISTIEGLRHTGNKLHPLETKSTEWMNGLVESTRFIDPEYPVAPEKLVQEFLSDESGESDKRI